MAEVIAVKSYFHKHDAEIAVGLLKDSGIEAYISADDAGGFRPHLTFSMNNNRVMVKADDIKKAEEVLKTLDETLSDAEQAQLKEIAQACKASDQPKKKSNKGYLIVLPVIIAAIFISTYILDNTEKQNKKRELLGFYDCDNALADKNMAHCKKD